VAKIVSSSGKRSLATENQWATLSAILSTYAPPRVVVVAVRLLTIRRTGNGRIPDSARTRLGSWFSRGIEQIHCGLCGRRGTHLLFRLLLALSLVRLGPAIADGLLFFLSSS
jgi:hypothetical protein